MIIEMKNPPYFREMKKMKFYSKFYKFWIISFIAVDQLLPRDIRDFDLILFSEQFSLNLTMFFIVFKEMRRLEFGIMNGSSQYSSIWCSLACWLSSEADPMVGSPVNARRTPLASSSTSVRLHWELIGCLFSISSALCNTSFVLPTVIGSGKCSAIDIALSIFSSSSCSKLSES